MGPGGSGRGDRARVPVRGGEGKREGTGLGRGLSWAGCAHRRAGPRLLGHRAEGEVGGVLGQLLASLGRARSLGRERGERGSLVGPLGPKQGERESLFSFFLFISKPFQNNLKKISLKIF